MRSEQVDLSRAVQWRPLTFMECKSSEGFSDAYRSWLVSRVFDCVERVDESNHGVAGPMRLVRAPTRSPAVTDSQSYSQSVGRRFESCRGGTAGGTKRTR